MEVKLLRNIFNNGKFCKAGTVIDVKDAVAKKLIKMNKATALKSSGTDKTGPSMKELIDTATELGIKKAGKKSRDELISLIEEAKAGADNKDDDLDETPVDELVKIAAELEIQEPGKMGKEELIIAIRKAIDGDPE